MEENRLELLRECLDNIVGENETKQLCIYASHMYGVSKLCVLLAKKRGLNAELAATCGMLHDIGYMEAGGSSENHALNGSKRARSIITQLGTYNVDEINIIVTAISNHSDKQNVHGEYDELLKDADVLDHCHYNPDFPVAEHELERYTKLMTELGIVD